MPKSPTLVTIPISHYCEKARWALDRAGIDYVEERHLQGFHHFHARRGGGSWTTPVLRFSDGRKPIRESNEIVLWVDEQLPEADRLYPVALASRVRAVEYWLDRTLGPDGRGWIYGKLLPHAELLEKYGMDGIPAHERKAFGQMFRFFGPYFSMRMRLQGTHPELQNMLDLYDEIAGRLEDGRRYLFGDRFTAADLTFAALSAPLVIPRRYGVELPPLEEGPPELRADVEMFRAHPAGQFALRVIDEQRPVPDWLAAEEEASGVAAVAD